ncbi:nuclear envelope integral membrane protein 1 [Daktulosphaira vitifoliae]|uniref:nuclear envelope integral membrane protein 1 n=1 Tax=Daktulosphaira vitifoliae TaxID=58002 RepID=UPI0021A9CF1D|nr:nuclear envelope integral membrane protein 1 [Daktulosphaira vitifoliae]
MAFDKYIYLFILLIILKDNSAQKQSKVYDISIGEIKKCCTAEDKTYPLPPMYCFRGSDKKILNIFQTIKVDLLISRTEDFVIYQAPNSDLLEEKMLLDESSLSFNKIISYVWRKENFNLDPFQTSCFSMKTNSDFRIIISSNVLDTRRLVMFIFGLVLFALSEKLSHNSLFYYLCGICIGVSASFLVIIFFISRLIPKKKMMLGFLGASCTLSLYGIQMLIENLNFILLMYYQYVIAYILFAIFISFVVCYRYGPVTNPRSMDIIRWTLQGFGLSMVTMCSYHLEAMVLVDVLSIFIYYKKVKFPLKLFSNSKPKLSLLTEDEYIQQGMSETPKALEDLRKYCRSPNCDAWKVMSKLRDPKMFAEFIETSVHVSDEAIEEHENEIKDDSESEIDDSSMEGIEEINYTSDSEKE